MPSLEELLSDKPDLLSQVKDVIGDKKLHVTNDGSWMPKERFNEVNEEKKQLNAQLTERDKQLENLKKSAGDTEKLQAEVARMQEENKAVKQKYESDMQEVKRSSAIRTALTGKVHNPEVAMKLLDSSKIELDETGNIKGGFDDQLSALEKSEPYLFVPKQPAPFQPKGSTPGGSNTPPTSNPQSGGYGKQAAQAKQNKSTEKAVESPYFQ